LSRTSPAWTNPKDIFCHSIKAYKNLSITELEAGFMLEKHASLSVCCIDENNPSLTETEAGFVLVWGVVQVECPLPV